jgi:hypothetical protein
MKKSPFPGMDPYLEARWSNAHVFMMAAISAQLNATLPEGLEARPEEEVRVETIAGERLRGYRPDIALIETRSNLPITWDDLPEEKRRDYLMLTFDASKFDVLAYAISLRDALPNFPVPLREDDLELKLD